MWYAGWSLCGSGSHDRAPPSVKDTVRQISNLDSSKPVTKQMTVLVSIN